MSDGLILASPATAIEVRYRRGEPCPRCGARDTGDGTFWAADNGIHFVVGGCEDYRLVCWPGPRIPGGVRVEFPYDIGEKL